MNSILRRGLSLQEGGRNQRDKFRVRTFRSAFRPGVDLVRLNALSDDLDVRREHRAEIHSNDTDFARFPGLRWTNPLD